MPPVQAPGARSGARREQFTRARTPIDSCLFLWEADNLIGQMKNVKSITTPIPRLRTRSLVAGLSVLGLSAVVSACGEAAEDPGVAASGSTVDSPVGESSTTPPGASVAQPTSPGPGQPVAMPSDPGDPPPVATPVDTPVDVPVGPPVDMPGEPMGTPVDMPVDTPVDMPVDSPIAPVDTPIDTPVDTPVDPAMPAPSGDCTIEATVELSEMIGTVGIVTFTSDLAGMDSAQIEFGLAETGPTMVAPVDLAEANYRTLLLGMKGDRDYVFRVVANAGETSCTSVDYELTTEPVANSVPQVQRTVQNEGAATKTGFLVLSGGIGNLGGGFGGGVGGESVPAFILDGDGDVVWWAPAPASTSRARMDWEGKNMWMMALNVGGGMGEVRRVSMDGLETETVPELNEGHHDFTVIPGGIVTAIVHQGGCSAIVERSPDGSIDTIVASTDDIYQRNMDCHPNAIHYYPEEDVYTVSDRNPNLFVKITRGGSLIWQLGGSNPKGDAFTGDTQWSVNHGHQVLENGNFLFFNNGSGQGASPIIELQLDEAAWTATRVWEYSGDSSPTLGDVQELPNGNILITYSNSGVIQELTKDKTVVQSWTTTSLGYTDYRETLYGPPPKWR
jgi:hypothetical protein